MCGIVATRAAGGVDDGPEGALARAVRALDHRGPDGSGLWRSPDGRAGLGHARLAILDLDGGRQPIASEDGQVVIAVNGELYDFERARRELASRGHRFRTHGDSEVALHLYEELGLGFVDRLRGEFAIVLWDARARRLVAARDRFGVKPLVWTEWRGALWLASEAKALFAAGVPAAWDEESFFHAASVQYVPPDRTLFAGVRQLPPGHLLVADETGTTVRRFWDLDARRLDDGAQDGARPHPEEAVASLAATLDEAVRLRLRADVPVGCYLSGGLDSSAIVGLAARHAGALDCFTVSFGEASYDELSVAEETAARAGARLHALHLDHEALLEALPDAVWSSEGLATNGHLPAKYLLARAARRAGVKVVLTGEGADELFAGYAHLRLDALAAAGGSRSSRSAAPSLEASAALGGEAVAALLGRNVASAGNMLPSPGEDALPTGALRARLGFVPSFLAAKAGMGRRTHALLDAGLRERFAARDIYGELLARFDVAGQLDGRSAVDQSLYLWIKLALAGYILRTLGDGTEMAHGLEGRVPFLDGAVYDAARALPPDLKIRGGVEKWILREAARPVLCDRVYRAEKRPFLAPPPSRFATARTCARARDLFASGAAPFYDRRSLARFLDELPSLSPAEQAVADPVLMTAMCAAILGQRYRL